MQIQLKQTEIIAALKQYISGQGINLVGKDVTISFTAGRKEAGVTADLVIEDAGIPGFDGAQEEAAKPALTVVSAVAVKEVIETTVEEKSAPFDTEKEDTVSETRTPPTSLFS